MKYLTMEEYFFEKDFKKEYRRVEKKRDKRIMIGIVSVLAILVGILIIYNVIIRS